MVKGTDDAYSSVQKLIDSMDASYRKMEKFRNERLDSIKQYVGYHYGEHGSGDKVPVNLLELLVKIYTYKIAASRPQVIINTDHLPLKVSASNLQLAINSILKEMNFESVLRRWLLDAIFGIGIIKTGITDTYQVEIGGNFYVTGQPFAANISNDDYVVDMSQKTWNSPFYEGNKYLVPYDELKTSKGFYDKKAVDKIRPSSIKGVNEDGSESANSITGSNGEFVDEYVECVELWDVFLPREQRVLTISKDNDGRPLRNVEWNGRKRGPYHKLWFNEVPDNLLPLPPASNLKDLHDISNRLFTKLGRQAEAEKTIIGYRGGLHNDAQRIISASDQQAVQMDDPRGVQQYQFGGVNPQTFAFTIQLRDLFSYLAGNLDTLGGLSAQAGTLGQEEILAASSNDRISDMRDRTVTGVVDVVYDFAQYLWDDPLMEMELVRRVPGFEDIAIPFTYTSADQKGQLADYMFEIMPYSMQQQTPGMKLQFIQKVVMEMVMPMLPFLQEQGLTVNFTELFSLVSDYGNMPELNSIITFADGNPINKGGGVEQPRQAPVTKRVNERVNRSTATRQGKDQVMMQTLMGASQPKETAMLARN